MARTHARVFASIWQDDEFLKLSGAAQRSYFLLLSQSDISSCGVIAYRPRRWAQLCADSSAESLVAALKELGKARFIVIDVETGEVWVRSFVKHDGILRSPNMVKAMWAAFGHVMSESIREQFKATVEPLLEEVAQAQASTPPKPSGKGSRKGSRNRSRTTTGVRGKGSTPVTGLPEASSSLAATPQNAHTTNDIDTVPVAGVAVLRPRDELWDAVMAACSVDTSAITDAARGRYNTAVASLRKVGADPAEVAGRAAMYRQRFGNTPLTPSSLNSHWSDCRPDAAHLPVPKVNGNLATLARIAGTDAAH